jgi:hypothetical protein
MSDDTLIDDLVEIALGQFMYENEYRKIDEDYWAAARKEHEAHTP